MVRLIVAALLILSLGSCGSIQKSLRLEQPINQVLLAGVGDTVVQIETRESLPNVVGKADIFGRTRPTGRVLLTYLGMEQGRVTFERQNIEIQSNATTMNSTPLFIPQTSTTTFSGSASVYGVTPNGPISGSAMTSGTSTTLAPPVILPPKGSTTLALGNEKVRYYLDPAETNEVVVEGHQVLIVKATPTSLRYKVLKVQ